MTVNRVAAERGLPDGHLVTQTTELAAAVVAIWASIMALPDAEVQSGMPYPPFKRALRRIRGLQDAPP